MAESIKKSDIIENDILKSVIIEFEQAQVKIKAFNDELRQTAKLSKEGLNNVKFNSVTDINQAKIAILEANNAIKQKVLLEKGEADITRYLAETKTKLAKAESDYNKIKERSDALTQKQTRSEQMLQSAYSRVNGWLGKLRNEYRDLAIKKELNGKLTDDEITRMKNIEGRMQSYDKALKKVDATMGLHQRNVGNYSGAFNGLGNSVNQLTREMPAFANSMQTGFMAISNNLPIFFDEINKIKQANKDLVSQGQPVKSVFSQIGGAIFSVGTALSVGVTLLTVYGAKIVEFISTLGDEESAIKDSIESLDQRNKKLEESIQIQGMITNYYQKVRDMQLKNYELQLDDANKEEKIYKFRLKTTIEYYDNIQKELFLSEDKTANLRRKFRAEKDDEKKREINKEIRDSELETANLLMEYNTRNLALSIIEREGIKAREKELEDSLKKQLDLERKIEDERIKRIGDKLQLDLTNARVDANRRIEDLKLLDADENQKSRLKKEIELTLSYDLKKIYDEYYKDLEDKAKAFYEKEINEIIKQQKAKEKALEDEKNKQKKWNDEIIQELDLHYKKINTEATNNENITNEELEKIRIENQIKQKEDELTFFKSRGEEYKSEVIKLEEEIAVLKRSSRKKNEVSITKSVNDVVKLGADYFIEQSNRKIAQIEKEQQQHEKAYSLYSDLAKNGNIQAKESLALENQQIVEANKKKQAELKKQAMWKLLEGGVNAYAKNAGDSSVKNPVMKTFSDITLLTQLLKTLPSFEVGTEDTGKNGNGIDGRGGFHAILHPNERVLTKEQNKLIGNVSNEDLALTMNKINSGELVKLKEGATSNVGNWQNIALISEIQDLKNIIKNKPDFKIEAGEIIQGAMSIVETKTTKNSIYSNRYIVK
jgi:hypothetical protein